MKDYHKKREISDSYWLYGKHPVMMAINNPKRKIRKLICTQNSYNELFEKLGEKKLNGMNAEVMQPDKIDRLIGNRESVTHQGVAIEVDILKQPEPEELINANIIVALDKITDPHNVGAIMRSSAAFGAAGILTQEKNSPPENATIAKISAGSVEAIPYIRVSSLWITLERFKEEGFAVLGLDGAAQKEISEITNKKKVILVIGSEGKGLSDSIVERCDELVKIDISEKIESLNASVAAAVALYTLSK